MSAWFENFCKAFDKIGYKRAAAELYRAGYIKEANRCLAQLKNL